jgi:cation/acetate symporter
MSGALKTFARGAFVALGLAAAGAAAWAAGADLGQAQKQATNWTAIAMFSIFVVATLYITKWAALQEVQRPLRASGR